MRVDSMDAGSRSEPGDGRVALFLLVADVVVLVVGLGVYGACWFSIYQSGLPDFSWGRGAYMFGVMRDLARLAVGLLLLGGMLVLFARYWLGRRAGRMGAE